MTLQNSHTANVMEHIFHANAHSVNVFDEMKRRQSILLTLFNLKNTEIINVATQAPSPSKDYCQLVVTHKTVIYRWWKILLRGDSESRYPGEIKDSYEDFLHDETIQRDISYVFGRNMLTYVKNIVEKGKLDILERLPEYLIIKIVSKLSLEDISRLSQVNMFFRKLCRSDKVWIDLYRQHYSKEISKELYQLAERDGWRKLFFTNKIKLQLELRRQAKTNDRYDDDDVVYYTPRRNEGMNRYESSSKFKSNRRDMKSGSANFRNSSTFITEY